MKYKPTIGLEIHIELNTKSKMFCSCKNDSQEKIPNKNICPICTGQPGTLPVPNKEAIKKVIKTGLSLNCKINQFSYFERKNYFYPDLPKGYQISQYKTPLCYDGYLEIEDENKKLKKISINRIHLEEDTGKLLHTIGDYTLVDLNRAGIPLMELVTEPEFHSAVEAANFAKELQLILRYLDVSNADMEKGQMRVEVNISLAKEGSEKLGTKVEIKNLNSFLAVQKSIIYEIERQTEILEKGGEIIQETRGWSDEKQITFSQREKEYAKDYRYFPEPDILPIYITNKDLEELKKEIPELPQQKRIKYQEIFQLPKEDTEVLIKNIKLNQFFENFILFSKEKNKDFIKLASNYLTNEILSYITNNENFWQNSKLSPENFYDLMFLIYKKEITSKIAKIIIPKIIQTGKNPKDILIEENLAQINKEDVLEKIINEVISENQKAVEDFKSGKENALQYLIGKIMEKSKGRANPIILRETLKKLLR